MEWRSKWAPVRRCVVACIICGLTALRAEAQAAPVVTHAIAPSEAHTDAPSAAPPDEAARTPRVLFIDPDLDMESVEGLHEAALAQFALIRAEIVFKVTDRDASLAERMTRAESLALEQHALAVFWIEEQPNGTWLLHMMDSESERVVIRSVDAAGARRPAAIEAVAVMIRESTRALIAGEPPAEPEPEPASPPVPPRVPAQAPARPWRLWLGYSAEDFASQVTWQHCLALGASWHRLHPLYGGIRLLFSPPLRPVAPIAIQVQRYPIEAALGYRYRVGKFALDGELGLSVDLLRNRSEGADGPTAGFKVTAEPAQTRVLLALEPRLRGELRMWPFLGAFVDLGAGILLNPFSYLAKQPGAGAQSFESVILRPKPVRPVLEGGFALYL
jgi:hypothetical protein